MCPVPSGCEIPSHITVTAAAADSDGAEGTEPLGFSQVGSIEGTEMLVCRLAVASKISEKVFTAVHGDRKIHTVDFRDPHIHPNVLDSM